MEKGIQVVDICVKKPVTGYFAVRRSSQGTTKDGNPFWSFVLSDATGSVDVKIWSPDDCGLADPPAEGAVLFVRDAMATTYRDALQISIKKAQLVTESCEVDPAWFCPQGEKEAEDLFAELCELSEKTITHKPWKDFLAAIFSDKALREAFCRAPGAVEVHHAYIGGLLEHTLGVVRLVLRFCDLYPELDRELLFVGALLHDIGKINEYACATTISVTDEGRLLGHMGIGLAMLEPFLKQSSLSPDRVLHLKHLILSHHGELAFGSTVLPQTQEAIALHFADNFDAKMAICRKVFRATKKEQRWTESVLSLDRRRLLRVEKTPEQTKAQEQSKASEQSKTAEAERVPSLDRRRSLRVEKTPDQPKASEQSKTAEAECVPKPVACSTAPSDLCEPEYTDDDAYCGGDDCVFYTHDSWNEGPAPSNIPDEGVRLPNCGSLEKGSDLSTTAPDTGEVSDVGGQGEIEAPARKGRGARAQSRKKKNADGDEGEKKKSERKSKSDVHAEARDVARDETRNEKKFVQNTLV